TLFRSRPMTHVVVRQIGFYGGSDGPFRSAADRTPGSKSCFGKAAGPEEFGPGICEALRPAERIDGCSCAVNAGRTLEFPASSRVDEFRNADVAYRDDQLPILRGFKGFRSSAVESAQ